jgi:hypothetical protein
MCVVPPPTKGNSFKGIISRHFVIYFLVSLDRSDVYTHAEHVRLLLEFRFHVELR